VVFKLGFVPTVYANLTTQHKTLKKTGQMS